MDLIYQPTGAALEYAYYALNFYKCCEHGCIYCFVPPVLFKKREAYFNKFDVKKDYLKRLDKDLERIAKKGGLKEEILLSFIGDPYQPVEEELMLTRHTIERLISANLKFTVLTKGGCRAVRDFDLLENYSNCRFGTSLVFSDQTDANEFEPNAAQIEDRIDAIEEAHSRGIKTWVSLEPVLIPEQALELIQRLHPIVNHWKIGKINHNKKLEMGVDWLKFRTDITKLLDSLETDYYLKNSLTELEERRLTKRGKNDEKNRI